LIRRRLARYTLGIVRRPHGALVAEQPKARPMASLSSRINWRNALTVVSASVLVGTEVFVGAVAGTWAISNLLGFGHVATFVLMVIGITLALLALWRFMHQAIKTEPVLRP